MPALSGRLLHRLGMSPVDEHGQDCDPEEQAADTRHQWELSYGHRRMDWPDPLREPYEPTPAELDLLHSQTTGHRWHGWRQLAADEVYYAACSCGWRSTETGALSPMLCQVKEHLDAVWAIRGGRPSARATPSPAWDAGERARELYAAVDRQQERLSQALGRSTDLLSASQEQADRLVAALEYAAARIVPDWARTGAAVRSAEVLQRRAERARQLRTGIIAAAAALAAVAEEVALVHQDLKICRPAGSAEHRRPPGQAGQPAGEAEPAGPARDPAAEPAPPGQELLDQVVSRLFQTGRSLQCAADLLPDAAMQPVADALQHVDDTIREIRNRVFLVSDDLADQEPRDGPS